jgi:hypothetical protein
MLLKKRVHRQKGGGKMLSEKRRGVTRRKATAPKNNQLHESYSVSVNTSTKKSRELIATLLIGLQSQTLTVRQCRHGWQLFEAVLRQYYDLKISGGQQL